MNQNLEHIQWKQEFKKLEIRKIGSMKGTWMEQYADLLYKEAMKNTIKSMRHVIRRDKIMRIYDLHL